MGIIAVLPIKSDSKGIPMKNFMNFCGKPMYYWALEACKQCHLIDKIYVCSSDYWMRWHYSSRLNQFNADFIQRPEELNGDVELMEVMKYCASQIDSKDEDVFMQIQVNKPLTNSHDLYMLIKYFEENNLNSLFTVQEIKTSVNWQYKSDRTKGQKNIKSCSIAKLWDKKTLMNAKSGTWGFGERHHDYVIGDHHVEIDDMNDFRIAEALKKAGF